MILTLFLIIASLMFVFFAWIQGKKHFVLMLLNSVLAIVFFSVAMMRFALGQHPVIYPDIPFHLFFEGLSSLAWYEWVGLLICGILFFWSMTIWYLKVAEKG